MAWDTLFKGSSSPTAAPTPASNGWGSLFSSQAAPAPYQAPVPAPAPAAPQSPFSRLLSGVENVGSSIIGGAKSVASDIFGSLTAPGPTIPTSSNPLTTLKAAADAAGSNFFTNLINAGDQMIKGVGGVFDSHQSALQRGVDVGEAGFGALNAAFAPINALLTYGQHTPVIAPLANGLSNVFSALGTGGADLAEGAVDALPISDGAKATVMPLAKEIGAFAAQILAGEAGPKVFKGIADKSKALIDTVSTDAGHAVSGAQHVLDTGPVRDLPVAGASEATRVPIANDYRTGEDIPLGKPASAAPGLPTIQADPAPRKVPGDVTIEPIKDTVPESEAPAAEAPKTPPEAAPPLKTEPGVSKVGKSIEVKAIDDKLTERFDKTAGYDTITIKDQAERAAKLVNENFDDARAVVRGEKPLPDGLRGVSVITAMEERLAQKPDADLAYELANSPLVSGTSVAAQEMRLAAERVPDSITAKFREVRAAREASLEKKGGMSKQVKKVVDDIQSEIKKTASKRPDWDSFIKDLTCKI